MLGIKKSLAHSLWSLDIPARKIQVHGDFEFEKVSYSSIYLKFSRKQGPTFRYELLYQVTNEVRPTQRGFQAIYSVLPSNFSHGSFLIEVPMGQNVENSYFSAREKFKYKGKSHRLHFNGNSTTLEFKNGFEGSNLQFSVNFSEKAFKRKILLKRFSSLSFIDEASYTLNFTKLQSVQHDIEFKINPGKYSYQTGMYLEDRYYFPVGYSGCPSYATYAPISGDVKTQIWHDNVIYPARALKSRKPEIIRFKYTSMGNVCSNKNADMALLYLPVINSSNALVQKARIIMKFPAGMKPGSIKVKCSIVTSSSYSYGGAEKKILDSQIKWSGANAIVDLNDGLGIKEAIKVQVTAPGNYLSFTFEQPVRYFKLWMQAFYFLGSEKEWMARLTPFLFLIFLYGFIAIIRRIYRKKQKSLSEEKKRNEQQALKRKEFIDSIRVLDPRFVWVNFLQKAEMIIDLLQKGWSNNKLGLTRSYLSQGHYHRFNTQIQLMIETEELRNYTSGFKILKFELMQVIHQNGFTTIDLLVIATIKDVTLNCKLPESLVLEELDKAPKEQFSEIYSFTRASNIQSNFETGAMPIMW